MNPITLCLYFFCSMFHNIDFIEQIYSFFINNNKNLFLAKFL